MSEPVRPSSRRARIWLLCALAAALIGVAWLAWASVGNGRSTPEVAPAYAVANPLTAGAATMDSPALTYSPGWGVSEAGADPAEPADAELTPSGVITFMFRGSDLALLVARGDYRGHLYASVDGEPANQLPRAVDHLPPASDSAGYMPLSAPENAGLPPMWIPIHHAGSDGPHTVRLEVWRSWGQTPLRAVGVDLPLSSDAPIWPGVALLVAAVWCAWPLWGRLAGWAAGMLHGLDGRGSAWARRWTAARAMRLALPLAIAGSALIALAIAFDAWWLSLAGMVLLGMGGLLRPAAWYAALFFALPFYFRFNLPLLPGRDVNLVDAGVFLGLAIALAHAAVVTAAHRTERTALWRLPILLLAGLASWALVAAVAAEYTTLALREWRTVFLMAAALGAGLALTLYVSPRPREDVSIFVGGWLAGAATVAAAALILYPATEVIVPAEGVARLRGFYGSPNNLALYLERSLAVSLALALFAMATRVRLAALLLAVPQAAALLLTFSRGALFLALPAMLISLLVIGWFLLRREGRSKRVLWWLAAPVGIAIVALVPFMGSDRLRNWTSLAQGTGLLRLNLWRSAWQMAQDHPLLGVGPDQFLYAYRSGYILPQAWMEPNLNHPHNWLLDWWTRLGVPGLALGVALWVSTAVGLARRLRPESGFAALAAGMLAATITALVHGLLDVSYALPDLMAVWALFAVVASMMGPQRDAP